MDRAHFKTTIEQHQNAIEKLLRENSVKAPAKFEELINFCIKNHVPLENWKPVAKILMDYVKNASIYKKRRMAEAFIPLSLTSKVILLREVNKTFLGAFSWEVALTKRKRTGRHKETGAYFEKTQLRTAVAIGLNQNGKLGTGFITEYLSELTPILVPKDLMIANVYMSNSHTIFLMDNGEFYAAGNGENFLAVKAARNFSEPHHLGYVSVPKSELNAKDHCFVTNTSSHFFDFNEDIKLVVGHYYGRAEEEKDNWQLVCVPESFSHDPTTKVTLEARGRYSTFTIYTNRGIWKRDNELEHNIVFIICGRKVDSQRLWNKISVCTNGTIYAHDEGTLYKGKLQVAPHKSDFAEDDEDDEDDIEAGNGWPKEVIVAFMDEVVLPFAVEGFCVSSTGDSMIFYPQNAKPRSSENGKKELKCMTLPLAPPITLPQVVDFSMRTVNYIYKTLSTKLVSRTLSYNMRDKLVYVSPTNNEDKTTRMEHYPVGLPCYKIQACALVALHHFLRIDEETKVPVVISKFKAIGDKDAYDEHLEAAEAEAIEVGRKMKPLMVLTSWEDSQRKVQISAKSVQFLSSISKDIVTLLSYLTNIPLEYRRDQKDTLFCHSITKFLDFIAEPGVYSIAHGNELNYEVVEYPPSPIDLKKIVETRIRNGDIDADDERFKVIRLEAIPTENPDPGRSRGRFHVLCTHINEFLIRVIDPELIAHIEEGVLNLNEVCYDDPVKFERLIRTFFVVNHDFHAMMSYEKHPNINIAKICHSLPPSEIYTITTSDDQEIRVPSILFELYTNGYDAGRRRAAVQSGRSELAFSVNVSEEAVELLMETLMDYRRFMNLDMKMKEEIFTLVDEMMVDAFQPVLLEMIVLTAGQSDAPFIGKLLELYSEKMYSLIAKHRPDIVFHWPEETFGNYLPTIHRLSKAMRDKRYKRMKRDLLVTMTADDTDVTEVAKVRKSWLLNKMSKKDQDQDVHWSLMNTVMLWSGYEDKTKARKRSLC